MNIDSCGNPTFLDNKKSHEYHDSDEMKLDELELFIMLIADYIESSSSDISKSISSESFSSSNDK